MVRKHVGEGSRVIMIGDSWTADIQGVIASGLDAILVRTSHPEARLFRADLGSLPDLLDFLGDGN